MFRERYLATALITMSKRIRDLSKRRDHMRPRQMKRDICQVKILHMDRREGQGERPSMKESETREGINPVESDSKPPLYKHRYLFISNGCKIHCLDLMPRKDRIPGDVPQLPIIATLNMLEENRSPTVALFKWMSNAYVIGGLKLPKTVMEDHDAYYCGEKLFHGLSLDNGSTSTSLSLFEPNMGKLKNHKSRPIVELINGDIHVIDRCLSGSHEVLNPGQVKQIRMPKPKQGSSIISYLVVGDKIYADVGASHLVFDSKKKKWKADSRTLLKDNRVDRPPLFKEYIGNIFLFRDVWDIFLYMFKNILRCVGAFPYGDPRDPLYVVIALECDSHPDNAGFHATDALAFLVTSTGQTLCIQPLINFFKAPVCLCDLGHGTIIKVNEGETKKTMCSIATGSPWGGDNPTNFLLINTFTVEELPDAASEVRQVLAKGSQAWPVELEFARVELLETYAYRIGAELGGGGDNWVKQACLL